MARHEQDREDLMREATALVRRVELQLADEPEPWVIGFRRGGQASVFVGADPVFQFNDRNELRRGYWNGQLVKAEGGRLFRLERRRTESEVQLLRSELTMPETHDFLDAAAATLARLRQSLVDDDYTLIALVPVDFAAASELLNWLALVPNPLVIASAPNVGARS